jgi:hypothetical protein
MALQNKKRVPLVRVGNQSNRDRIWAEIRTQPNGFTLRDVRLNLAGISNSLINDYVKCLVAGRYLTVVSEIGNFFVPMRYTLIKDCGVDAPRVGKEGEAVTRGAANENMWRTMKILKRFDWQDLMIAASTEELVIKENTVRRYVETLYRAGYLHCVRESTAGVRAIYLFNKNTGNRPPMIRRDKSVYDPNLDTVVYQRGGK